MIQNYEVTIEEDDGIFATIVIEYPTKLRSLFSGLNPVIRKVLDDHSVEQKNVINLNVTKNSKKVKIKLTYSKFDLVAITECKSEKEQIISLLNELGYTSEKIKKVEYEKEWPKCDELDDKIWKVELDEHFDPDESFSQHSYEFSMSKKISKVLGFKVSVSIY